MDLRCIYSATLVFYAIGPVLAQNSSVGNGSAIAPSVSELGDYGLNGMQTSESNAPYSTRHYHRGNYSGIGGSFIGTTSPTAESTPALKVLPPSPELDNAKQFRLPKLDSNPPDQNINPALNSYTSALPTAPNSNALINPVTTAPSFKEDSANLKLESLPSFSYRQSFMDNMKFNSLNSFKQY